MRNDWNPPTDQTNGDELPESGAPPRVGASPAPAVRLKCSYCGVAFRRDASPVIPFCSLRCQQMDLGNWLSETYGLPVNEGEFEEPDEANDASAE